MKGNKVVIGFILVMLVALSLNAQPTDLKIYFADMAQPSGAVYCYDPATHAETTVYARPSGRLYTFLFAPWAPDNLYFVNANEKKILRKRSAADRSRSSILTAPTCAISRSGTARSTSARRSEPGATARSGGCRMERPCYITPSNDPRLGGSGAAPSLSIRPASST